MSKPPQNRANTGGVCNSRSEAHLVAVVVIVVLHGLVAAQREDEPVGGHGGDDEAGDHGARRRHGPVVEVVGRQLRRA